MRAPIRDVGWWYLDWGSAAGWRFHDNNIPDTDMRENKCHWGRLFGGSTLCRLSYTVLLLTKITHTNTPFCSYLGLSQPSYVQFIHSGERSLSTALSSLSAFIVCTSSISLLCICGNGGGVRRGRTTDRWQIRNTFWCCATGEWLGTVLSLSPIFVSLSWCLFFLQTPWQILCLSR